MNSAFVSAWKTPDVTLTSAKTSPALRPVLATLSRDVKLQSTALMAPDIPAAPVNKKTIRVLDDREGSLA